VSLNELGAVAPVLAALKDPDASLRMYAARALGYPKTPRAVEPLIASLKDPSPEVRGGAASALVYYAEDPRAVSALLAALRKRDMAVIDAASTFLIERCEPGLEDALIENLNAKKDGGPARGMADEFLNSENPKLEAAARAWASGHGYVICKTFHGQVLPRAIGCEVR
jgi:HEAT repeat protein